MIRLAEGAVSASLRPPADPGGTLFVLAHGAGGHMGDALLAGVDALLAERGHGAVRFNFLYREEERKLPDAAPRLEATYRGVLDHVRREVSHGRLVIGGKSMGGRMATHLAAQGERVGGLLLLGYPLHPAKKPERLRAEHLSRIEAPALFLQGTRDPLCDLARLRPALAGMPRATLVVVEDGDHSLAVRRSSGRTRDDVSRLIGSAIDAWLRHLDA